MRNLSKSVLGTVAALALTASAAFATVPAQTNCAYSFSTNMKLGNVSSDVMNLQKLLNKDVRTQVSASGVGSAGSETSRFGPATFAAVKKFQAANGVSPVSGFAGPLTRAMLNTVCNGTPSSTTTPVVVSGPISVSAASSQPNSTLVAGQASANLGTFTFTGNGSVANLTLMRTGVSSNDAIVNAYLFDGNTRITDGSSVNNNGMLSFNNASGLFTVSGSKTLSVRADIKTGVSGQTIGVSIASMTVTGGASSTPVVGVMSGLQAIATADITKVDFTQAATPAQPTPTTISAGSVNQNLWSRTISLSQRAGKIYGFTVKQVGSAPTNAIANAGLFLNGTKVASANINGMNQFVFDLSSAPIAAPTGTHTLEVRGDVVAGSARDFYLVLEQASDLRVEDSQLTGVFVNPTLQTLSQSSINLQGGKVTVQGGSLVVTQNVAFNNVTTLVSAGTNRTMASFRFQAYGEDMKVNSLTFNPTLTGSTPAATTLGNVGLFVAGAQVGSNQTVTVSAPTPLIFNSLGSNLIVPAGTSVLVEIRGDVSNTGSVAYTAGSVKFDLAVGANNAQGQTSQNLINTSGSAGQTLTIQSSNVTVNPTVGFAASTKAPNQQGIKIGSFTVQTGSAESVELTNIVVGLTGTLLGNNRLSNIVVKDGSTVVGTPVGNPTATNNFSANLAVGQSTSKVLDVYADLGTAAPSETVLPTMTVSYRGTSSNVSTTVGVATGVTTTSNVAVIAAAGVTFVPGSSPTSQIVVGGNSALGIATFNVKAVGNIGGAKLKNLTFTVPVDTISQVTVNGKSGTVSGTTATIFDVNLDVPADASGVNFPATVALIAVGTNSGQGVANSNVSLTLSGFTYNNGSTVVGPVTVAPVAVSAIHTMGSTKPTLTVNASNSTGLTNNVGFEIGRFTVAADAGGDIQVEKIGINTTFAGAGTLAAIQLRDSANNIIPVTGVSVAAGVAQFILTTPRTITKGTSEVYVVTGTTTLFAGAAGTQNVSFQLDQAKSTFVFTDVTGGITAIPGTNINPFPTGAITKSN